MQPSYSEYQLSKSQRHQSIIQPQRKPTKPNSFDKQNLPTTYSKHNTQSVKLLRRPNPARHGLSCIIDSLRNCSRNRGGLTSQSRSVEHRLKVEGMKTQRMIKIQSERGLGVYFLGVGLMKERESLTLPRNIARRRKT